MRTDMKMIIDTTTKTVAVDYDGLLVTIEDVQFLDNGYREVLEDIRLEAEYQHRLAQENEKVVENIITAGSKPIPSNK